MIEDDDDIGAGDWAEMARKFFKTHGSLSAWCIVEQIDDTFGIAFDLESDPVVVCPDMQTAAVLLGCLLVSKDALANMEAKAEAEDLASDFGLN